MKKLFFTLILTLFCFVTFSSPARAEGNYRCQNSGGLCTTVNIDCGTGFGPDTAFCAQFNNNPAGCDGAGTQACISTEPVGAKYKCVGAGSCVACASNETCQYNSRGACESDPSCDPAGNSFNKVYSTSTSSCNCVQVSGTSGKYGTIADCLAAACTPPPASQTLSTCGSGNNEGIPTAIGCIPITSVGALTTFFLRWGIGISGGVAFLSMIYAGFLIMSSAGDPKRLQTGQELVTSSVSGIILLVFSIFILRLVGVNILGLF